MPDLTDVQKAYNVAQSNMFQLAAYGHHRYHPLQECLTDEGKRQQRNYNDRLLKAREDLEAAVLRLVADHGERYRTLPTPLVGWLRTLADDPAERGLLALTPEELRETLGDQDSHAPHPPVSTWTFEGEYEAGKWHGIGSTHPTSVYDNAYDRALAEFNLRAETDKEHLRLRMLRADTVYTVVAEHTPDDDAEGPE